MGARRAEDTMDDVARFLDPYVKQLTGVRVDAIGIGYNFGLYLRKKGFPVELVNVGLPCESKPELGRSGCGFPTSDELAQLSTDRAPRRGSETRCARVASHNLISLTRDAECRPDGSRSAGLTCHSWTGCRDFARATEVTGRANSRRRAPWRTRIVETSFGVFASSRV